MQISYNKPKLNDDGTVLLEQVSVMRATEMPNGIRKRELKVIQELYPDVKLLKETIAMAAKNYEDESKQGHKTVEQLGQEKKALEQLKGWVAEM